VASACLGLLASGFARAYEAIEVKDGGSLHGAVRFAGKPPAPARLEVTRDQTVCGESVEDVSLVVGKERGVANVVVHLEGVESGKAVDLAHAGRLDNVKCQFAPHVQSLSTGQTLLIRNLDPVLHNTHSYVLDGEGNLFNLALPRQGQEIRKLLKKPGVHQVRCDAGHTWMNGYFLVFDDPYYAVTDTSGEFSLAEVPPGTYTLRAWHEKLGTADLQVRVARGKDSPVPEIVLKEPPPGK